MRAAGIQGAKRRGKPWRATTTDAGVDRPPDLVDRDYTAPALNQLWLADFTYLRCWQGVVFLGFIIDAFSRRIVSWQFSQACTHRADYEKITEARGVLGGEAAAAGCHV